jgi:hypothetical protein
MKRWPEWRRFTGKWRCHSLGLGFFEGLNRNLCRLTVDDLAGPWLQRRDRMLRKTYLRVTWS